MKRTCDFLVSSLVAWRFFCRWFGNFLLRIPIHGVRRAVLYVFFRVSYPNSTYIGRGCRFLSRGRIKFGKNSIFNNFVTFDNRGFISFGDNVIVSECCIFQCASHDIDDHDFSYSSSSVVVGSGVWLASRSVVLPGSRLADGCVVGADSVASGWLSERDGVYVGVPARFKRHRLGANNVVLPHNWW